MVLDFHPAQAGVKTSRLQRLGRPGQLCGLVERLPGLVETGIAPEDLGQLRPQVDSGCGQEVTRTVFVGRS